MKTKLFFALSLFLLTGMSLYAQSILCYTCGLTISGSYTSVEGHYYCAEHFLCSVCNLPIHGRYTKDKKNFVHVNCHPENKSERKDENCIICGEPFEDFYSIDHYQNKYHREHVKEYKSCSNCGRLICKAITNGGITYGDSREMCSICYKDALFLQADYNLIIKKVLRILKHNGIDVTKEEITIKPVNSFELKQEAGLLGKIDNLDGLCKPSKLTSSNSTTYFKIFVLSGLPAISTESILAHELMHAWIFANTGSQSHSVEIEGICNYISFRYLQISENPGVHMEIRKLEENPNLTYGKSFRDIREKFGDKPLSDLLDYVKTFDVTN